MGCAGASRPDELVFGLAALDQGRVDAGNDGSSILTERYSVPESLHAPITINNTEASLLSKAGKGWPRSSPWDLDGAITLHPAVVEGLDVSCV